MTLAMLAQVACTGVNHNDETAAGEASQAVLVDNALVDNALVDNALVDNALVDNALVDNALVDNALVDNALVNQALTDPNARELFKYIVSCALPAGSNIELEIQGQTYDFPGKLGLAPEWGEEGGSCDAECKSWVSACVISRLDYTGESVTISVRGDHEALTPSSKELNKYKHREATYYGNIFSPTQKIFACLPPGQTSIPRVCGPSLDDCVVEVQGNCEDLCGNRRPDGSYPNCRAQGSSKKYEGSISVFLKGH
jgi:hypothetical protein